MNSDPLRSQIESDGDIIATLGMFLMMPPFDNHYEQNCKSPQPHIISCWYFLQFDWIIKKTVMRKEMSLFGIFRNANFIDSDAKSLALTSSLFAPSQFNQRIERNRFSSNRLQSIEFLKTESPNTREKLVMPFRSKRRISPRKNAALRIIFVF